VQRQAENVTLLFGPHGTWNGGREKAPAALYRKVATAAITGKREIEIRNRAGRRSRARQHGPCYQAAVPDRDWRE